MKNINKLILFLSIFVLGVGGYVYSSLSSDFVLNNISADVWKRLEFDRLALDVTLYPEGDVDSLQSLSVMNLNTAYYRKGLEKLILWQDERSEGFQGTGVDLRVGEATWDNISSTWYWDDVSLFVPKTGLRIFISVETERTMEDQRTVRLVIPKLVDSNGNGQFDVGDRGVFFLSGNNGPTDAEVSNDDSQTIRYEDNDLAGPKSVITNLFDGDSIVLRDDFIVSGFSKDQGKFGTELVQISIVGEGSSDNWQDVSSERFDFGRWTYNWTVPGAGTYNLKLKSRDSAENETISDITTIIVVDNGEGIVSSEQSKLSIDKEESLADGKIYVNALVVIKDSEGDPLSNKNVELSYLRDDGYVAKNTQTTDESGTLVWGVISTTAGAANLTAIADGVELNEHPVLTFTNE